MPRPLRIAVLALLTLVLATAAAQAHTAQVLPRGSALLDLGSDPGSQLIHAALEQPDDQLVVKVVVPEEGDFSIEVFVPDQAPERDVRPEITLSREDVAEGGRNGGDVTPLEITQLATVSDFDTSSRIRTDDATRLRYRELVTFSTDDEQLPRGATVAVLVKRGATPLRVAVRTDAGGKFRLDNVEDIPKTVTRLGGWFTTPAAGAPKVGDSGLGDGLRGLVWIPISIAGGLVLIMVWWLMRGRRTARARGVERAIDERPEP